MLQHFSQVASRVCTLVLFIIIVNSKVGVTNLRCCRGNREAVVATETGRGCIFKTKKQTIFHLNNFSSKACIKD